MEREDLMDLFRRDIGAIEPTRVWHDEDPHPAFKRDPKTFKFEHSTFLFKVWMAGRSSSPPPEDVCAVVDEPVAWEIRWADDDELYLVCAKQERADRLIKDPDFKVTPLYRHPQRPMVLPERICGKDAWRSGWNACIDRIAELNK